MALLGISLALASLVLICLRHPTNVSDFLHSIVRHARLGLGGRRHEEEQQRQQRQELEPSDAAIPSAQKGVAVPEIEIASCHDGTSSSTTSGNRRGGSGDDGEGGSGDPVSGGDAVSEEDEQTTPKASTTASAVPVPALSLSPLAAIGSATSIRQQTKPPTLPTPTRTSTTSAAVIMPPPPPGALPRRPPTLRPLPATAGASALSSSTTTSSSLSPLPARRIPATSSSLAPPPTPSSRPPRPSRGQVALAPGFSPLDWARLSADPAADLRGLPPGTPFLRVTTAALRRQTGRRGKDAWTVLRGRVYNITPYLPFHPGGVPELLRCAARDGTDLFTEIHPWVNYEGMLASCLVGIYVGDDDSAGQQQQQQCGSTESSMEAMD